MADEHPIENLAAHALGSLEHAEREQVDAHVASCGACAARLRRFQGVVGALPLGLEPAPPPPDAWEAIRTTARQRRARQKLPARPAAVAGWLRLARWPALAAALAMLLVWNVTLQRELTRRAPGPAPGPEVEALSRRPGRVVIFAGTGKPGASARLFVAVDGGGHLAVSGLSPLPRERMYQLWFVRSGSPAVTGAIFGVDDTGRAWVKVAVPASLEDVEAIAITDEPTPGGSTPTGPHLLDALPWR